MFVKLFRIKHRPRRYITLLGLLILSLIVAPETFAGQIPSIEIVRRALPSGAPNGNPILPPKWAFGVLFGCYYNQAQLLDAMQKLRNGYCGDLIWADATWLSADYTNPKHYICFKFDSAQFGDPRKMIAQLHSNHFKFGVWEWPFIDVSVPDLYKTGESNHYFITDKIGGAGKVVDGGGWHGVSFTGQIDFTNPAAALWFKQLNQPLLDMGLDFLKLDAACRIPSGGVLFDGSETNHLRSMYHKTGYEITQTASGGRGFILGHSLDALANDQHPGVWTGDTNANWNGTGGFEDEMKRAAGLNKVNTGAYWGGDIAGFNSDITNDELYIRWLEYGCFTPLTEFFGWQKTCFPWVFGATAQEIFKTYTRLRYRLLPFRYSNAQICYHESPVKYPVRFVSGTADELIVGNGDSEMLAAPLHVQGARAANVRLPAGKPWINYWTGEVYVGGSVPRVAAPLEKMPLFVKAGSIIPMGPEMEYVDQKPADPLTLDIYPFGKTSYTLYEDDGLSNDYLNGAFSKTVLAVDDMGGLVVADIGAMVGSYQGKLENRTYILMVHKKIVSPLHISINGEPVRESSTKDTFDGAARAVFNDAASSVVWVKFSTATGNATRIMIKDPQYATEARDQKMWLEME